MNMTLLQVWQEAILSSWDQVWFSFLGFLPLFVGAVIIFVIGIFLAHWSKRIVEGLLYAAKLEDLSESSGFAGYLKKADIKFNATQLLGELVRWVLLLIFFIAAVEILGLDIVSRALTGILNYVPNVVAAALVLGAGFIIANFADGAVRAAFASIDHEAARPVGKLSRWVILLVAFFAAVDQLKIAPALVDTFFQGLTWTLVLVVGLALGLGSKDLVAKFLDDWYKRLQR